MRKIKHASAAIGREARSESMEQSIEDLGTLLQKILEGAAKDLSHDNAAIVADAFYWVMCPRSELYSDLAELVGIPFRFDNIHRMMADLFKVALPPSPITEIIVDTGADPEYLWCGEEKAYVGRLASIIDRLPKAFAAMPHPRSVAAAALRGIVAEA